MCGLSDDHLIDGLWQCVGDCSDVCNHDRPAMQGQARFSKDPPQHDMQANQAEMLGALIWVYDVHFCILDGWSSYQVGKHCFRPRQLVHLCMVSKLQVRMF